MSIIRRRRTCMHCGAVKSQKDMFRSVCHPGKWLCLDGCLTGTQPR